LNRKIYLLAFIICLAGVASLVFIFRGDLSRNVPKGDIVSEKIIHLNLDQDKKDESVSLKSYKEGDNTIFILTISKSWFLAQSVSLSGFQDEVKFCDPVSYNFSDDNLLCLIGNVGAHSQNIQFVAYKDRKIDVVKFKTESGETANMVSDEPNFAINHDLNLIHVDNRNYELDPLSDALRTTYRYRNGVFTFVETSDIVLGSSI